MTTTGNLQARQTTITSLGRRRDSPIHLNIPVGQVELVHYQSDIKTMIWTESGIGEKSGMEIAQKFPIIFRILNLITHLFTYIIMNNDICGAV